jgi:hypothetical protein
VAVEARRAARSGVQRFCGLTHRHQNVAAVAAALVRCVTVSRLTPSTRARRSPAACRRARRAAYPSRRLQLTKFERDQGLPAEQIEKRPDPDIVGVVECPENALQRPVGGFDGLSATPGAGGGRNASQ